MKHFYSSLIVLLFFIIGLHAQVQFSEQAVTLGCDNTTYGNGVLGGGISFFDFNNDGWDDITLSSQKTYPLRFFQNNGGFFSEVDLGIEEVMETKTVQWVDFDNDGDYDLFATSNDEYNILYENLGNLQFVNITGPAGLQLTNHKTYGGSWGDYNNDGFLDLFVSSRDPESVTVSNLLFRNNGNSTFTNVSVAAGISPINHTSFCAAFFDYNKDGWQDIYVANDRAPVNQMYRNNGNGTFTEVGAQTGTNIFMNAMSTTIGDYNRDGWLDVYITNTFLGNVFLKNNGNGTFTDVAPSNGTLMESTAWGAVFLDAENDTDLDLYVSAEFDSNAIHLSAAFYENDGNGMYTIPQGIGFENDLAVSYGNAIGDIDNDGYPEIVVLNYFPSNMYLWKNESPHDNNWLKVKLQGVESNRQGVGSWIEISVNGEKQYNYTLCGEGYLGQNSAYEFFGIGTATSIDYIKVTWLSGIVDIIENPSINTSGVIIEGSNNLSVGQNNIPAPSISLFPNPGSGILTIHIPQEFIGSNLTITDMNGRILTNTKLNTVENKLDLSAFPGGVYLLNFENGIIRLTKKLIIM